MALEDFFTSEIFFQVIYSVALVVGAYLVIKIISRAISKFSEKAKLDKHTIKPMIKLVKVIVWLIALISLLGVWGLTGPLSGLLAGAGVMGIVIGFAAKDVFADLFAGIMLFFDRPFKIGHVINIGKLWGIVEDIGLRSTKIKTFDGKFVTIPNTKVAGEMVANVSIYEGRRLELVVGVDYDTNIKKAKSAIEKAAKRLVREKKINPEPPVKVFADGFGDSSINFKVLFWYNPEYTKEHGLWFTEIKAELMEAIKQEFDKSGIVIPYPQVTLSERKRKKV